MHKKEIVEAPPMVVVYIKTPQGLHSPTTGWVGRLSVEARRRFYKNWINSKKKAFTNYAKKYVDADREERTVGCNLERIKKHCTAIRIIAHTQATMNTTQLF